MANGRFSEAREESRIILRFHDTSSMERKSRPQISVGTGSIWEPFRLRRGGTSCFLPENPRLHVLPVRVILGCKLPASLVGVGEAARLRRQRHSQKQAQLRLARNY